MDFNKSILYRSLQNLLTAFLAQFQFTEFFFFLFFYFFIFFNFLENKNKAAKLKMPISCVLLYTVQKMKLSIKDFFSKCDQFRGILCSDSCSIKSFFTKYNLLQILWLSVLFGHSRLIKIFGTALLLLYLLISLYMKSLFS